MFRWSTEKSGVFPKYTVYRLRVNGSVVAKVAPTKDGWYWHTLQFHKTANTAHKPKETVIEAKKECEAFIRKHIV